MNTISIDGQTLNNISRMYAMHQQTRNSEFEFRFGTYVKGRFVPGVSRGQYDRLIDSLKTHVRPVVSSSVVTLYPSGFRSVDTSNTSVLQKKTAVGKPVSVHGVGRFALATESPVARIPSSMSPTGVRVRDRTSFGMNGFSVDATRIDAGDRYEVEIEFGRSMRVRDMFETIKQIRAEMGADSGPSSGAPVPRDVAAAFTKLWDRGRVRFNNAVNMKRRHFESLGEFVITPKWDGTRMALFVHGTESSLFNVTTSFRAQFTFDPELSGTVFDGEFFEDTGKFIAYDILFLSGKDTRTLPRIERTLIMEQTHAQYGITFDMAAVSYGSSLSAAFIEYTTKYPEHTLDGVVFAPRTSPYYNKQTLKYKPIELLTIDFLIKVDASGRYDRYLLFVQGPDRVPIPFKPHPVIQKVDDAGKELIGDGSRIIECKWEYDTFVPHRIRHDKTVANYVTIALDIWEDLNDPITESEMGGVLAGIAGTFDTLEPFEGRWIQVGTDNLVVASAGEEHTPKRCVAYAQDARFQLLSAVEQDAAAAGFTESLSRNSDKIKRNIHVVDACSGKLVFSVVNYQESIVLAYIVGPRYYVVGRFVDHERVCARVDRVYGESRAALPQSLITDIATVEKHYDAIPTGVRSESSVIALRKYNNWIKSMLIALTTKRDDFVLDLGSGKGGDLGKWCHAKIGLLTSVDISEKSLEHAKERYMKMKDCQMSTVWIHANPYADILDTERVNDIVSSQFSFHYAFGSPENAEMAVRNIAENLRTGGLFIATIPNAARLEEIAAERGAVFGNSVYMVAFDDVSDIGVGSRYTFTLTGSVEGVPEYIVPLPYLVDLFRKHGMELEWALPFPEFVKTYGNRYKKVAARIGVTPLSPEEREAVGLYMTIVFKKTAP